VSDAKNTNEDALFLAETCLNKARYHGFFPWYLDVQALMTPMSKLTATWTEQERAEADAWRERGSKPGTDPAPAHVNVLIQRAQLVDRLLAG
jgi:hypothetical protein